MKVLIVGVREGNLGEQIMDKVLRYHGHDVITAHVPSVAELNVEDETSISSYLASEGPFDQIVYAAGLNSLKWISDLEMEDLERSYRVNVFGLVMIMATHERMYPASSGSVTAIVSDSYRTPMRGSIAYSSSKTALTGAIRNMARELAPRWRVNGVSPGIIADTPMTKYIDETVPGFRGWDPEQARKYEESMIPMGRRVFKSEVADLVVSTMFGPDFMTGSIVEITGGK